MNKIFYLIANWKMNIVNSKAEKFLKFWLEKKINNNLIKVILCPSYTELDMISKFIKNTKIDLGAQNVFQEKNGSYTGQISCSMLKEYGCKWVIVGHSESRKYSFETNEIVNQKMKIINKENLNIILCIGESFEDRKNNNVKRILRDQIISALNDLDYNSINKLIIAYEPIWSIGSGNIATKEMIFNVNNIINNILSELSFDGDKISIIYGGSVNANNVNSLVELDNMNGFLVGGSSLNVEEFYKIYKKI